MKGDSPLLCCCKTDASAILAAGTIACVEASSKRRTKRIVSEKASSTKVKAAEAVSVQSSWIAGFSGVSRSSFSECRRSVQSGKIIRRNLTGPKLFPRFRLVMCEGNNLMGCTLVSSGRIPCELMRCPNNSSLFAARLHLCALATVPYSCIMLKSYPRCCSRSSGGVFANRKSSSYKDTKEKPFVTSARKC